MEQERSPSGAGSPATSAPKKPRRWAGTVIAAAVVLGLAGLSWHLTHQSGGRGPGGPRAGSGGGRPGGPATTVGVSTAATADVPVHIDALGTVTPSATVTVTPQVSGVLTKVDFQEGQMVKAGQLLATIDPRPFEFALMQAQGQQLRDEAQLDAARLTLQRYQALLAQDSIARQEVDTQAATVKQLEGAVLGDKASVGSARVNLGWTRITAPVAGRIGLRAVDVGNLVSQSTTGGVAVITELAPIDVEFAVPQDRIPQLQQRIAAGARLAVTAFDRTRTQTLDTGVFLSLDNQTDTQTGTVRAKARFANAGKALFPSQFVNVRILLDTLKDTVVVPVTAVRHGPDGDFVYVLDDDRTVHIRKVTQGLSVGDKVQVPDGLRPGEKVVTEGADRLKDGARVVLPGDAPPSAPAAAHRRASGASHGRSARDAHS